MSEEMEVLEDGTIIQTIGDWVRVVIPVPKIGKHTYITREGKTRELALAQAKEAIAVAKGLCHGVRADGPHFH